MIDASSMEPVSVNKETHSSHKMSEWESTVVACASNSRFGKIRECTECGGRDVIAGGVGSRYHDPELSYKCEEADR